MNASNDISPVARDVSEGVRAPYQVPRLQYLGDVRDLTLGGSPGTRDSGTEMTEQF